MRALRPLAVLALHAILVVGLVLALVRLILPAPAPSAVTPRRLVDRALTDHLLFVVIDGLRHDVASDPERMPNFARALRERASAEPWAGRVTMTTSAVLAFGTGQRGRFEQIVRNLNPEPPPFHSWLDSAHRRGLLLATVGDPAWVEMYGSAFAASRPDPKGVSIDVDFNPQTFRDTRELLATKPALLIAHFVTPDHQGHVHGIASPGYTRHIRGFDAELFRLLGELSPAWTVVVTSDHGAVDSGTHGSDTAVQRHTPALAYGPGIRSGVHLGRVEQVDLAPTLATLLGVEAPAHGLGFVMAPWLDLSPAERAGAACRDAERALALRAAALRDAPVVSACDPGAPPERQIEQSRSIVRATDAALTGASGITSPSAWLTGALGALLLAIMALITLGRPVLSALPGAVILCALATLLVSEVERLPGALPNVARVVAFTVGFAPALVLLFAPGRFARWVEAWPRLSMLYVPGALVASYPANAQPVAWVSVGVLLVVFFFAGRVDASALPPWRASLRVTRLTALGAAVVFVALHRVGTIAEGILPSWFHKNPPLVMAVALGSISLLFASRALRRDERVPVVHVLAGLCLVVAALLLRDVVPPWLGRGAIVALGLGAIVALRRGQLEACLALALASTAFVSRTWELPVVAATLFLADAAGRALRARDAQRDAGRAWLLLAITFAFALLMVQRIGIQGALDFGGMDFGAGGFGDPHVPAWWIGVALGWKYVSVGLLALLLFCRRLEPEARERLLAGLAVAFMARSAVLMAMLFVAGDSYWTGFRVLGDLPFGLLGVAIAGLAWLGQRLTKAHAALA